MTKHYRALGLSALYFVVAMVAAVTASPVLAQETAYRVDPVAITGEPAPGTAGLDFEWVDLLYPYLSDAGVIAFIGSPTGVG
jgi:hypothetical protein